MSCGLLKITGKRSSMPCLTTNMASTKAHSATPTIDITWRKPYVKTTTSPLSAIINT